MLDYQMQGLMEQVEVPNLVQIQSVLQMLLYEMSA
jgi:hypothetical protein